MIRQTITCDACGIERKEVNHWFEAYEHEGELRIRGLNPTKTTRAGLRHLCGQTCLHRLVDDFLAGNLSSRMFGGHDETKASIDFARLAAEPERATSDFDLRGFESSARLVRGPVVEPKPVSRARSASPKDSPSQHRKPRISPASAAFKASPSVAPKSETPLQSRFALPAVAIPPAPARTAYMAIPAPAASDGIAPPAEATILPASLRKLAQAGGVVRRPPKASVSNRVEAVAASPGAFAKPGAFEEPPPYLTPQMRRSQAWERERAREKHPSDGLVRDRRMQELL